MENNTTINVTLDEAREWYNSGNEMLKELALKCFPLRKLNTHNFENIKTFEDAVNELGKDIEHANFIVNVLEHQSKASAAMYKLNIVRKALNLEQDLHLTKDPENSYIYYPYNPFVTENSTFFENQINSGEVEIIGKFKSEGKEYNVLGGYALNGGGNAGLGYFYSWNGMGDAFAAFGFIGCANKEIAKHLGKYFGMLITEAKYGDMVDFEILDFVKTKNADEKEYSVECSMTYNGHVKVNAESQEDAIEKAERLMDSKYGDDFPNYGKFGLVTFKFSDATADSAYEV